MSEDLLHELPEASRLALASSGEGRGIWLAAFALDARMGSYVLGAHEPMLAQVRLAWWRDQLGREVADRPRGDPLLDLVGTAFPANSAGLSDMVNGWEALLVEAPVGEEAIKAFLGGRSGMARSIALELGCHQDTGIAERASGYWALADLAHRLPDPSDRDHALALASSIGAIPGLSRKMRPLAVLAGLSRRALSRGGQPLLGDRLSPLVALRLGMLGK